MSVCEYGPRNNSRGDRARQCLCAYGTYANMEQGGPLWALCFYHFRCTMPTVPAAAPFTSVSACLTTFMELIAPVLAHRPTIYLPFILYSISGSLPFTGASRPARENGKLRPSFYQAADADAAAAPALSLSPGSVCYVHSSIPFHSFALRCFSCLRALPAFCFCVLWLARPVIFCTCSRLEYFMGLSAFS